MNYPSTRNIPFCIAIFLLLAMIGPVLAVSPVVTYVSPYYGSVAGGTTVTVTGTGFTGATDVFFGNTGIPSTQFVAITDTKIIVSSPAGSAGPVDITVVTPEGTSVPSYNNQFTYEGIPTISGISPNSGPTTGYTGVTITGTGFLTATAVEFNGIPTGWYNINSDTQIYVYTPQGSGTVHITVVNPEGVSATSPADQFTYTIVPVFYSFTPSAGPISGGTTVTIYGSGFTGATGVTFGGIPATGFTVDSDYQITAISPAGTDHVDITVNSPYGTVSSASQFTYEDIPTVTGISPTSGPVNGGTWVTITGTGFLSATEVNFGGVPAYSWGTYSDTMIGAYAPAGSAGTVDITVVNPEGTSAASSADQFTYVAGPAITGISPSVGYPAGGTTVTISGSGFTGATNVYFVGSYGGTYATSYTVDSDTQITAVSPPGSGTVDIYVYTPEGSTSPSSADEFTYNPYIAGISPVYGSTNGGTLVTIYGSGFTGVTDVNFGITPASSFILDSDTQITAVSPAGSTGPVDITAVNPQGTSMTSSADLFTYEGVPTITSISPAGGPATGGTWVTITGTGFLSATEVDFNGVPVSWYNWYNSDTEIYATSPAGSGTVDITVVNPEGTSATSPADQFRYEIAPVFSSFTPLAGPISGGTIVMIYGSGFTGATSVTFGATPATGFTLDSDTQITAVSPPGTGSVSVTVESPYGNVVSPNLFTYDDVPTVTGISPTSGPEIGGWSIIITGTGFLSATEVNFGGVPSTSWYNWDNSGTTILAYAPAGSAGTVDITVVNSAGTSLTSPADQFTYILVPKVTGISPSVGLPAGGTTVTISGEGFTGASDVYFGNTQALHFTLVSDNEITAVSPAGTGTVDIRVYTPQGGSSTISSADQFAYKNIPIITSISPAIGPATGGTTVTIVGSGFNGVTGVSFGGVPAASIGSVTSTMIIAVSPPGTGTVDITVDTPEGTSAISSADLFTYNVPIPAPVVTGISPSAGIVTGGTTVTITGTGFNDVTAVMFSTNAAASYSVDSANQITAVAPAGSGIVDIFVTTPGGTSALSPSDLFIYLAVLPGQNSIPTDPDGDRIFEDLNGNGRLDFDDDVLYFNQMTWIAANEPAAAFDLNRNGRIDFDDIVALFNEI